MRKFDIVNSWYPDATPDGKWCCALFEQAKVATYVGQFDLGMNLLFVRCNSNPFKFAGQDNAGTGNYELTEDFHRAGNSFGVNPVIYDNLGNLNQAVQSHQGYRFCDENNRIWTGDETLLNAEYGLYEWTKLGNVIIGQFAESKRYPQGGAAVGINGKRRVLEEGTCVNIRMQYSDGTYAIALGKQREIKSKFYWAALAELEALPEWEADDTPIPPDPPDPIPPDPPKPDPPKSDFIELRTL